MQQVLFGVPVRLGFYFKLKVERRNEKKKPMYREIDEIFVALVFKQTFEFDFGLPLFGLNFGLNRLVGNL